VTPAAADWGTPRHAAGKCGSDLCAARLRIAAGGEQLQRRGGDSEGKAARARRGLDPHRPHRLLYIAVDAGQMGAPASAMGAGGPMTYLLCAKKGSQPANRVGRRDAGWDTVSARVALRRSNYT
jgi:hypothetical protein